MEQHTNHPLDETPDIGPDTTGHDRSGPDDVVNPTGEDRAAAVVLAAELAAELIGTLEAVPAIEPIGDTGRFTVDGTAVDAAELIAIIGDVVSDALAYAHQIDAVTRR